MFTYNDNLIKQNAYMEAMYRQNEEIKEIVNSQTEAIKNLEKQIKLLQDLIKNGGTN